MKFPVALLTLLMLVIAAPIRAQEAEGSPDGLTQQRKQFRAAYKALNAGQKKKSEHLAQGLELYPLYPFLHYENLRRNLHRAKRDDVQAFLAANEDSALGETLRTRWLRRLANRGHWKTFLAAYRPQKSAELRCEQLLARVKLRALDGVVQDAVPLWLTGKSQEEECDPAFALLYKSPLMTEELLWQRIRLTMKEGNTSLAGYLGRKLPPTGEAWVGIWREVHRDPRRGLRKKVLRSDQNIAREIIVYGLQRLARREVGRAQETWARLKEQHTFTEQESHAVLRNLALRAVLRDHDDQISLHDAVPPAAVDADVQRSQLRAAIRLQDWNALQRWTRHPAAPEMNDLRWRYWRARALEKTGDRNAAVAIYRRLSTERDYYGFRAADQLAVEYKMQNVPLNYSEAEMDALTGIPGIARAQEFHAIDLTYEARREWLFEVRRMEPRQMEVAARLAHQLGWHDRAILTLGRAGSYDDVEVRFPLPQQDLVIKYAKKRKIPHSLMLSIIRAESAFMEDARSPAGALGLMQVMPATGRQTARTIGYRLRNTKDLQRAAPNITIGSAYLSQMLKRFNGNVAMAAAAYNAGPHQVNVWQPRTMCQRAEDWIELISFTETRRYVRKILFYIAVYQWRMAEQITPLDTRAAIPTRGNSASCSV